MKHVLFKRVGKTPIVPLTAKISIVVVILLLVSNFATNYINLVFNQREVIKLTNSLLVKDLKDLYTFAGNQYNILQYSKNLQETIDAVEKNALSTLENESAWAMGVEPDGTVIFYAATNPSERVFPHKETLNKMADDLVLNKVEDGVIFFTSDKGEVMAVYKFLSKWNCFIVRAELVSDMMASTNRIYAILIVIILVIVAIFVTLAFYMVTHMLRFVRRFTSQMLDMQERQSLELISLDSASNDEMGYLGASFNNLSFTINNLLSIFRKFVTKDVVKKAYSEHEIKLEGKQMELTILFSDIRGFTYMTETLGNNIINLLNVHYNKAIHEIHVRDGIVGSIIGDALLAVYGTISESGNKSEDALLSAYAIHEVVRLLRIRMQEKRDQIIATNGQLSEAEERIYKAVLLDVGVGIDGGNVFYGNIGSVERMTNTVIGDNVNSASRLEGLTRVYQTSIIVSKYVADEIESVTGRFAFIELDTVQVKGKTEGKKIYVPIDKQSENAEEEIESYKVYSEGLQAYYDGNWNTAREKFRAAKIPAAQVFLNRIKRSQAPEDWNGIWTMTTK